MCVPIDVCAHLFDFVMWLSHICVASRRRGCGKMLLLAKVASAEHRTSSVYLYIYTHLFDLYTVVE